MATRTYLTCAETAKLVRKQLATHFPGVKFSVKSSTYSMGASIHISWTDGPRDKEVERIANSFEGASFDGMNDLKSNQDSWLLPNGSAQLAYRPDSCGGSIPGYVSDAPAPTAQMVCFGSDFVFTCRHISDFDSKQTKALEHIRQHCHCEGDQPNDRFGNDWVTSLANRMVQDAAINETIEQTFDRVILRNS